MNENKKNDAISASEKPIPKLRKALESQRNSFIAVANKHLSVERLIKLTLAAAGRTPKILECSTPSVLQFCMRCAETGLEPIGAGGAWPIPYENRKDGTVELQFIPDYRGMIHAAKRAGCIGDAYAETVKEGDEFEFSFGLNPDLIHVPSREGRGELTHAYCVFELPTGKKRFVVMDREEIENIRNRTPAWKAFLKYKKACPWNTDEGEQWKKTAVRRAMKPFAGATPEMTALIEYDNESSGVDFKEAIDIEPVAMPEKKETPSESDSEAITGYSSESSNVGILLGVRVTDSKPRTKKPWKEWFCTFEDDDGNKFEAETFSKSIAESLDTLKGQIVKYTYKPAKKEGQFELLSIEPDME